MHSFNELRVEMQNVVLIQWESQRKTEYEMHSVRVDDNELVTLNEYTFELCISVKTEIEYNNSMQCFPDLCSGPNGLLYLCKRWCIQIFI